jgi:uncharacterized protein YjbJ (UPF0337 family)
VKEDTMSGKLDKAKGRTKKAAGDLTGDESLKSRGRTDEAKGKVKSGVDKAASKTKRGIRKAS